MRYLTFATSFSPARDGRAILRCFKRFPIVISFSDGVIGIVILREVDPCPVNAMRYVPSGTVEAGVLKRFLIVSFGCCEPQRGVTSNTFWHEELTSGEKLLQVGKWMLNERNVQLTINSGIPIACSTHSSIHA